MWVHLSRMAESVDGQAVHRGPPCMEGWHRSTLEHTTAALRAPCLQPLGHVAPQRSTWRRRRSGTSLGAAMILTAVAAMGSVPSTVCIATQRRGVQATQLAAPALPRLSHRSGLGSAAAFVAGATISPAGRGLRGAQRSTTRVPPGGGKVHQGAKAGRRLAAGLRMQEKADAAWEEMSS